MIWYVFFFLALLVLVGTVVAMIVFANTKKIVKRRLDNLQLMFTCSFFMAFMLCIPPVYAQHSVGKFDPVVILETLVFPFQKAIRVFGADEIYDVVQENLASAPVELAEGYYALALAVQFIAPFLTFGFVISFLKNLIPYFGYSTLFWKDAHIFSELNEKSAALAASIIEHEQKDGRCGFVRGPLIVFTDVSRDDRDKHDELLDSAKKMGAIIFKTDLETIHLTNRFWNRKMNFYLISDIEDKKIRHASWVAEHYDIKDAAMYVFSDSMKCELLLSAVDIQSIKVYRIDDIQALIYHNLSLHGLRLFKNAAMFNDRTISAVIVGLGKYGFEMFKALVWYGQVRGFKLKITVFDCDEAAESRLCALCPELMKLNRNNIEGEAHYDITVHGGVNVNDAKFYKLFSEICDVSYVFAALGNDSDNIDVAVKLRAWLECMREDFKPDLETVVYSTDIKQKMSTSWTAEPGCYDKADGIRNYKSKPYLIHMIGDLESFYSVDTVIDSELAQRGLEVNGRWAKNKPADMIEENNKNFWRYSYHYRSSIAKALHEQLRRQLIRLGYIEEIRGAFTDWEKLGDAEKLEIGKTEHVRWNAYMRAEGFCYSPKRNDLAKRHHNLVSVKRLLETDPEALRNDA